MKKLLTLTLALLVFCSLLAFSASADEARVYVDYNTFLDNYDAPLTDSELSTLENALKSAEENSGVKFRVYITDSPYVSENQMFSDFGVSAYDDLAILQICESGTTYSYELFLYGDADSLISYDESDAILDDSTLYSSIKSGELAKGAVRFATITADTLVLNREGRKNTVIFASVFIALAAGSASVGIVVYKYKKKLKSPSYPLSKFARLTLDYHSDHFIGSSVTRTRVSSSSSGGRSGGRGGGSRGRR